MDGLERMGDESCWTLATMVATGAVAKGPTIRNTHEQDRRLDTRRLKCFSSVESCLGGAICVSVGSNESNDMCLLGIMYRCMSDILLDSVAT